MKVREVLNEGLDRKNTYKLLLEFIRFAARSLKLKSLPKFDFVFDSKHSVERSSFGGYGNKNITITVKDRHIMDVFRTLAHEMVHYKQDLNNELDSADPGATGSPQENQANAEAAVIMRNFGRRFPDTFGKEPII